MKIGNVSSFYFSPTKNTKRVMEELTKLWQGNCVEYDMTDVSSSPAEYYFLEHELVFIGAPVYSGRIPEPAVKRFQKLHGKDTPAVLVVTYGNRDYDDALLELKLLMEQQGFRILAAAAVVAEHNIIRSIGTGRPDESDDKAIRDFGHQMLKNIEQLNSSYEIGAVKVKGNIPFREYMRIPLKPKVGKACTQCKVCIRKCPVQAISRTDARVMDEDRCISCMRCIAVCPTHVRGLNPFILYMSSRTLKKKCKVDRKPEFYFETGR